MRHAHYSVPVFGRLLRPAVLIGSQGTAIYGQSAQDPATSILSVMRNLTSKLPRITAIRSDIEGVPEERIYEALDAVSAAFRLRKAPPTCTRTSSGTQEAQPYPPHGGDAFTYTLRARQDEGLMTNTVKGVGSTDLGRNQDGYLLGALGVRSRR